MLWALDILFLLKVNPEEIKDLLLEHWKTQSSLCTKGDTGKGLFFLQFNTIRMLLAV